MHFKWLHAYAQIMNGELTVPAFSIPGTFFEQLSGMLKGNIGSIAA